jgi:predicted membrane-bound spermidine synthase
VTLILYLLFILSGAAGLFYESVWSRYLSLFVGHAAYAQVIVLVMFLGGMAIGAVLVSRFSERLRDPLYGYALVELGVGLLGLAFHDYLYLPVTGWAYDTVFPALGGGLAMTGVKWAIAGALILPQSVLLGATFPLMSAGLLRRTPAQPGRVLSLLYFTNSLGAAAGVLVAGFFLVSYVGLPGTLISAAILNLLVGLAALTAAKYGPAAAPAAGAGATPAGEAGAEEVASVEVASLIRLLLFVSAGTALASFIYEISWIRLLSLVLGSATHSFELMLSAFILGLALGALWIRRRSERLVHPLRVLALVQVVMGALAIGSLIVYSQSFAAIAGLMQAMARTDQGYTAFTIARYGLCLLIMLPATFCAGMTLPLLTRTLLVAGVGERAIGQVYGSNTLGSILGAGIASLVMVPLLGLKGTLVTGGALDMLVGVAVLLILGRRGLPVRRQVLLSGAAVIVLPLLAVLAVRLDRAMLTSGVFRTGVLPGAGGPEVTFYRDGRTATVSTEFNRSNGRRTILTNGKPDGAVDSRWLQPCVDGARRQGMAGDDPTQVFLAILTMAHVPAAKHAAVIGHGTGMSSHTLLGSPVLEDLATVEIEPVMVTASRTFYPANRRVFDDPRSHFVFDDAKAYFASANRTFDLILSEPSNPWVSGVSGLFTTEFYQRVRRYLAPGGVMGQWLHTYELTDDLVLSVLGAIHQNFADYAVFAVNAGDLLIVASADGPLRAPDWSVFGWPGISQDLCRFHRPTSQDLEAVRLTGRAALSPLLDQLQVANSDFYPVLDLGAERARYLHKSAAGFTRLFDGLYDFVGPLGGPPLLPDTQTVSVVPAIPRIAALLGSAALRADPASWADTAEWRIDRLGETDGQVRAWIVALSSPKPVAAWPIWTRGFWAVFSAWHAGSRGFADPALLGPVHAYLDREQAPAPVRAAVRFREHLARHEWAEAAEQAGPLVAEAMRHRYWVDPAALQEGATLALIGAGLPDSALVVFRLMSEPARRAPDDLRGRLLRALVETTRPSSSVQKP